MLRPHRLYSDLIDNYTHTFDTKFVVGY